MSLPDSAEYWDDVHRSSMDWSKINNKPSKKFGPMNAGFTGCPICGKKPKIYDNKTYYRAICRQAKGKHIDHELSMYGNTLDELRGKWNRRV